MWLGRLEFMTVSRCGGYSVAMVRGRDAILRCRGPRASSRSRPSYTALRSLQPTPSPNEPSSADLVEAPKKYDGTSITFTGRPSARRWSAATTPGYTSTTTRTTCKNVEEGAQLGGYNTGMAVWIPAERRKIEYSATTSTRATWSGSAGCSTRPARSTGRHGHPRDRRSTWGVVGHEVVDNPSPEKILLGDGACRPRGGAVMSGELRSWWRPESSFSRTDNCRTVPAVALDTTTHCGCSSVVELWLPKNQESRVRVLSPAPRANAEGVHESGGSWLSSATCQRKSPVRRAAPSASLRCGRISNTGSDSATPSCAGRAGEGASWGGGTVVLVLTLVVWGDVRGGARALGERALWAPPVRLVRRL